MPSKIENLKLLTKQYPEIKELLRGRCGDCVYFRTEKCRYTHVRGPLGYAVSHEDAPCVDAILITFIGSDVLIQREKTQIVKPVRFLSSDKAKDELMRAFELDAEEVEDLVLKAKTRYIRRKTEKHEETPKPEEPKEIYPELRSQAEELLRQPDLVAKFIAHSDMWLVLDTPTRKIELLGSVSTLSDYPLNLSLLQLWSTGKTTITVTTCKYFEKGFDVWLLGYMSPKTLIHEKGAYDKETDKFTIDLQFKIIGFLEEPSFEVLNMLKPLLSHDRFETLYKYVDKQTMKTVSVILRGWPACFFCSAKSKHTTEFTSRWLTCSPQISTDKIRKVLEQKADRAAHPEKYEPDEEFRVWQKAFSILKEGAPYRVVIPYAPTLQQYFRAKKPEDMRFFELFLAIIKASTILYALQRAKDSQQRLISTIEDYETAYDVFEHIERPTAFGLGQNCLDFYENIILPLAPDELAYTDYETLLSQHAETYGEATTRDALRENYLKPLEKRGLISTDQHPTDKRKIIIYASGPLPEQSLIDHEGFMNAMSTQEIY